MSRSFLNGRVTLHAGDCLAVLPTLPENSADAVVTDPPYHLTSGNVSVDWKSLGPSGTRRIQASPTNTSGRGHKTGFMGKQWDGGDIAFRPETWAAVLRVLKPGGHMLAFAAPKNAHRMICAIEDAGFEIRDCLMFLYGAGFPKSLDVSKAIDRARDDYADICRVALWLRPHVERIGFDVVSRHFGFKDETMARARWTSRSQPNVPRWEQWIELKSLCGFSDEMDAEVWRLNGRKGTPGEAWNERKVVGRGKACFSAETAWSNSLSSDYDITAPATDAARAWEGWGTALKPAYESIVLARKPLSEPTIAGNVLRWGTGALNIAACRIPTGEDLNGGRYSENKQGDDGNTYGSGINLRSKKDYEQPQGRWPANCLHDGSEEVVAAFPETAPSAASSGQPTPRKTTEYGIPITGNRSTIGHADSGSAARFFKSCSFTEEERDQRRLWYGSKADADDRTGSRHPTIKPVALVQWLVRLVTPPKGTVLDIFAGTGTTGEAAFREGFSAVLIEREPEYIADIERRMKLCLAGPDERARESIKARLKDKPMDAGPLFDGAAA